MKHLDLCAVNSLRKQYSEKPISDSSFVCNIMKWIFFNLDRQIEVKDYFFFYVCCTTSDKLCMRNTLIHCPWKHSCPIAHLQMKVQCDIWCCSHMSCRYARLVRCDPSVSCLTFCITWRCLTLQRKRLRLKWCHLTLLNLFCWLILFIVSESCSSLRSATSRWNLSSKRGTLCSGNLHYAKSLSISSIYYNYI